MGKSTPGTWSLVAVPAILTLLVTVVRLLGELQGWNPSLFNTEAGGGGALVGITWLVLPFGFWFGWRLRRAGATAKPGRAAFLYVAAIAVMAGGIFGLYYAEMVSFPNEENPGQLEGMPLLLAVLAIAAVVAIAAWPRLTITLMAYGVLARLPIVILTYVDIQAGWDTHYGALPPGAVVETDMEMFLALATPQATLWPFIFTPIVGGLLGCLGATAAGKSKK